MTVNKSSLCGVATVLLLTAVAARLWTPVHAAGQSDKAGAATHRFVTRSEAETHKLQTAVTRIMLTADETNGRYSIVDEEFKAGMKSFMHKHAYHSETFIVIAG